jgi:hypothetical protein
MCSHDDRVHVSVIVVLFALDSVTLFHLIVISSADESLRHGWFQLRVFLHLVELGTDLLLPCFHNNCHPIVSESSLTKLGMRPRSAALFLFPTFLFPPHYQPWVRKIGRGSCIQIQPLEDVDGYRILSFLTYGTLTWQPADFPMGGTVGNNN